MLWFIIYRLYYVEIGSFYDHFFEVFLINVCLILSNAFSASIAVIIQLLSFNLYLYYDYSEFFFK